MEYRLCADAGPQSIAALLQRQEAAFALPCGGCRRCGKCRVQVLCGHVSPPAAAERRLLGMDELAAGFRLACACQAQGEVVVRLADAARPGRTAAAAPRDAAACAAVVDLGTTTVACRLLDATTRAVLGECVEYNSQRVYGADVVSRINAALRGAAGQLRALQLQQLQRMLDTLAAPLGLAGADIHSAVIVGNTAELHLLAGVDISGLAAMPFTPAERFGGWRDDILPGIPCYLPPVIGAYLGADLTAGLLAAGLDSAARRSLLFLDIGTNSELALLHNGQLFACSAATGPVFEGAGLHAGMLTRPGAVCAVCDSADGVVIRTNGNEKAPRISGSGALGLLALLLRHHAVSASGKLRGSGHDLTGLLTRVDHKPAVVLPGTDIVFTQGDIRQMQLGKAAVAAAAGRLLAAAGCSAARLDGVILAGGFGAALDSRDAMTIGLLPRDSGGELYCLGNTALHGATLLLDEAARQRAALLAANCHIVELAGDSRFQELFLAGMRF